MGLEKLKNHEEVIVKVLLNSKATDLYINTTFVKKKKFKMEKLRNPFLVRNMNSTMNVGETIIY